MLKNEKCRITKRIVMNMQNLLNLHNILFNLQRFCDPKRARAKTLFFVPTFYEVII